MERRIMDMGLRPDSVVEIISAANSSGPVVVKIGDTRLSLGRGMAQKILVRPL